MSQIKFDVFNKVEMVKFVESLTTESAILENSLPIILNPLDGVGGRYLRTLRYGDVSMEALHCQKKRVKDTIEACVKNTDKLSLSKEAQELMIQADQVIESRLIREMNPAYLMVESTLDMIQESFDDRTASIFNITTESFNDFIVNENLTALENLTKSVSNTNRFNIKALEMMSIIAIENVEGCYESVLGDINDRIASQVISAGTDGAVLCEIGTSILLLTKKLKCIYRDVKTYNAFELKLTETLDTLESCASKVEEAMGSACSLFNTATVATIETMVPVMLCELMGCSDDEVEDVLCEFARYSKYLEVYYTDILAESKGSSRRKFARAVNRTVNSTVRGAQKAKDATKTIKKKTVDPMETFIEDTFKKIKGADREERKQLIIKGGIVPKVMRYIKRGIVIGGVGMFAPTIAGISLITYIALDKSMDSKARRQVLTDYERELEIVNEKIEDSKGDEDKQKKYELIRIRQKLEKDINRIRYRID